MILIDVVTTGRSGWVIARDSGALTADVVGQVYRISPDGEPEEWKAWLLPVPGHLTSPGQHVHAITRQRFSVLQEALRQRAARDPWWRTQPDYETRQARRRLELAAAEYKGTPS